MCCMSLATDSTSIIADPIPWNYSSRAGLTQLKSGLVPFHRSVGPFPAWGVTPVTRGGCDLIGAFNFSTVSGLSNRTRVRDHK